MQIFKAGVITGLVGGALDFAAASTIYPAAYPGLEIVRIWQSVAEGVLGPGAYDGGIAAALLGVALHFGIAIGAGLVLAAVMAWAEIFRKLWPVSGTIFGASMYYFMQLVVLPMSLVPLREPDAKSAAIGLAIHILIFGLPMAFVAARLLKKKA